MSSDKIKCMKCGEMEFISLVYVPNYPVCDKCISIGIKYNWVGDKL